ncbi:MAG: HEAT repeat domain-containing protein [Planctomycetaceae bacterium]
MSDQPRRDIRPDDDLPTVEPPSAGFLVQLFVVPLSIVACGLFVVWGFYWLAQMGNDPESYVRALRRNNEGRWQVALNFANDLRGPGGAKLKGDPELARDLAGILADEVASGRPAGGGNAAEQSRTLCDYLCRALGEFAVPEAAAALVARAADDGQPETARAAVEALAVLASNLSAAGRGFDDRAAVVTAVLGATDGPPALRSSAAYTLGVLGGDAAVGRLRELVDDADDDVRYNAAIGLARQGDDSAWPALAEMLALPDTVPQAGDARGQAERYRRAMIVVNALKGVGLLVDATKRPPPEAVGTAISALASDAVADVRSSAAALSRRVERLGGPG